MTKCNRCGKTFPRVYINSDGICNKCASKPKEHTTSQRESKSSDRFENTINITTILVDHGIEHGDEDDELGFNK